MIDGLLMTYSALTILMVFAGLAFGLFYFAALKRSVALFVGDHGWSAPLALTAGRISASVIFLFGVAKLGAAPLLAAFIGFLIARALALRAEKETG
jgi:hypothetical protein